MGAASEQTGQPRAKPSGARGPRLGQWEGGPDLSAEPGGATKTDRQTPAGTTLAGSSRYTSPSVRTLIIERPGRASWDPPICSKVSRKLRAT